MRWRAVVDRPEFKIRAGQQGLESVQVKTAARATGKPAYLWAIPEDLGKHFTERSWPVLIDMPVELGRELEAELVDGSAITEIERTLREAEELKAKAEAGLRECQGRLAEIEARTRITGANHTDHSSFATNCHHLHQWQSKLAAASADCARLTVELESLRDQQARAERHKPAPEAGTLKSAADLAQDFAPNDEPVANPQEVRRKLLRLAVVVQQFDGLRELLADEGSPVPRFCYPPSGHDALVGLRSALKTWAERTGRDSMELRHLRAEMDVVALIERAHQLVEEARETKSTAAEAA